MSSYYTVTNKIKKLRAIHDRVIVSDMESGDIITEQGILIPDDNMKERGIRPRWAKVYAVGPEQHDVIVGQWILVEHGRWTLGISIEDDDKQQTIRMIDPNDILLVSDENPLENE